jgi:phosphopantothenoylcysteine synthetase/decarboxylase
MKRPHLLAVPCGAGPAADIGTLISIAQRVGWSASVTATPSAVPFLDVGGIETMTGAVPRTGFEPPADRGQTRTVRKADAIIIAPATYNSINKLAAGIADNYALTVVAELVGVGLPTVVVPFVNAALARRAPYRNAIRALEGEGVYILGAGDQWEPHEPGTGSKRQQQFPWQQAFDVAATHADGAGVRNS